MLLESQAVAEAIGLLRGESFYRQAHARIFEVMLALFERNEPIDEITVVTELRTRSHLDGVGGPAAVAELTNRLATAANVTYHAQIVRDRALSRKLIQAATQIVSQGYQGAGSVDDLIDQAESQIFEITSQKQVRDFSPIREVVRDAFKLITSLYERQDPITGVATGYHDLDAMTSGLQPSDLIIVAGRPSMGKTAFALGLAQNVAVHGRKAAAVFSLEMSKEQLAMRMLCSEARIDSQRLRAGSARDREWPRLAKAAGDLSDAPLFIDDTGSISILEMRAKARRLKAEVGLGIIVVDYLQLMRGRRGGDEGREREISEISRGLKALAKELHVPVVALSQLNRSLEQRADKRPMLSDLRESGAIEQDADVICFVYRDEYYNAESEHKGVAEIIVGKQRNGPTGSVRLRFFREFTRFENLAKEDVG